MYIGPAPGLACGRVDDVVSAREFSGLSLKLRTPIHHGNVYTGITQPKYIEPRYL